MKPRTAARIAAVFLAAAAGTIALSSDRRSIDPPHQAQMIRAGELNLRAVRAGHGPGVVLIHGYGESLVAWQALFDLLTPHFDVLALDLPGMGLSSKPATGYQTDSMAARVLEAIDASGMERVAIIGHSLGGALAASIASNHPGRVRALVLIDAALVVNPTLLPDTSAESAPARLMRSTIARYEMLRSRFSPPHAPQWLAESALALAYSPADDPASAAALSAILREFDFEWLTAERAARIVAPSIVIWGALDPVVPPDDGARLARQLNAPFHLVHRSWHRPHVERPSQTAELVIPFLNSH